MGRDLCIEWGVHAADILIVKIVDDGGLVADQFQKFLLGDLRMCCDGSRIRLVKALEAAPEVPRCRARRRPGHGPSGCTRQPTNVAAYRRQLIASGAPVDCV
ncbi:hypothetical protein MY3296_009134 [Beauveria thailandica]